METKKKKPIPYHPSEEFLLEAGYYLRQESLGLNDHGDKYTSVSRTYQKSKSFGVVIFTRTYGRVTDGGGREMIDTVALKGVDNQVYIAPNYTMTDIKGIDGIVRMDDELTVKARKIQQQQIIEQNRPKMRPL